MGTFGGRAGRGWLPCSRRGQVVGRASPAFCTAAAVTRSPATWALDRVILACRGDGGLPIVEASEPRPMGVHACMHPAGGRALPRCTSQGAGAIMP